jgi:hypothetical protein
VPTYQYMRYCLAADGSRTVTTFLTNPPVLSVDVTKEEVEVTFNWIGQNEWELVTGTLGAVPPDGNVEQHFWFRRETPGQRWPSWLVRLIDPRTVLRDSLKRVG